jgi:nitrite reductase (NADH) large subunit
MGAAGFSGAETIRRFDPKGEILMISPENAGYYSRPALAFYLSKEINERSLFPRNKNDFKDLNIKSLKNLVSRIDPNKKEIYLKDQKQIDYDQLLLTPGAKAVQPQIDGIDLEGVFYLDSLAQTKKLIRYAKRGNIAVVAGGGITALEIVEGLSARKMEVHFFLRGNLYWNRVLDSVESEIILHRLEEEGVIVHRNTEIVRITGEQNKVSYIHTNHGKSIQTNLAAFAVGVRPRISLAAEAGAEVHRGIKVNPYMETNLDSIYAAGDAAEVYDPHTKSWVVDSLWHVARQQGIIAGQNMAGGKKVYQRRSPINVTRLAGLTTMIIGSVGSQAPEDECSIVRGESEIWQLMPDAVVCQKKFEVNRLRLMVGRDQILGAVLIGDQSLSQILEKLITGKVNISSIREILLKPDENIGKILLEFSKTGT